MKSGANMEDFGHIKAATGHRETFCIWAMVEEGIRERGRGRGHRGSRGGSGRIKAKDGGRVLSPAVQLR